MQEAVPVGEGAMAAILGLDAAAVGAACEAASRELGAVVTPANLNAPGQVVIAGQTAAVARAGELAQGAGREAGDCAGGERAIPLPADEAGAGTAGAGAARAGGATIPAIPVVANVDGLPKTRRRERRSRR